MTTQHFGLIRCKSAIYLIAIAINKLTNWLSNVSLTTWVHRLNCSLLHSINKFSQVFSLFYLLNRSSKSYLFHFPTSFSTKIIKKQTSLTCNYFMLINPSVTYLFSKNKRRKNCKIFNYTSDEQNVLRVHNILFGLRFCFLRENIENLFSQIAQSRWFDSKTYHNHRIVNEKKNSYFYVRTHNII